MSNESYVLLSIGPVQGYISQARRTQDMFMGSRLLTIFAKEVLRVAKKENVFVVHPTVPDLSKATSIPNRILFRCESTRAATVAGACRDVVYRVWQMIAENTLGYLGNGAAQSTISKRQIKPESWLEVHYVIVDASGTYQTDNSNANSLLSARKLVRDFEQQYEPGFKCSITGEHEALHDKDSGEASDEEVATYWKGIRSIQRNKALLSEGERLCALSVVKRFGHENNPELETERFPSTSSIAAISFRAKVIARWDELRDAVASFLGALEAINVDEFYFKKKGEYNPELFPYLVNGIAELGLNENEDNELLRRFRSLDGDFLYEAGLTSTLLKQFLVRPNELDADQVKDVQNALRGLYKQMRDEKPSDYLAILTMDADGMGEHVRWNIKEEPQHTTLSQKLADFAANAVRDAVEEKSLGRVVYAGGDDLLAVLPADAVLKVAREIHQAFIDTFREDGLTISAGIAVVHRAHSLQAVVRAARDAQERAKHNPKKDSFCVSFLKRSGEAQTGCLKWTVKGEDVVETLLDVEAAMRARDPQQLSRQLPYEMDQFLYALVSSISRSDGGLYIDAEIRKAEFGRIFKRRCTTAYKSSQEAEDLLSNLTTIGEYGLGEGAAWRELTALLRLVRFLSQQEEQENVAVH